MAREQKPLTIVMIDIDYFKHYNDCYGRIAGDEWLKKVAAILSSSLYRPRDMVARFGGEELTLVLPATDTSAGVIIAQKI